MTNIEKNDSEFLWVQKYRPRKVADTILPAKTKQIFQEFVDKKQVPNLLLAGGPGTGKTTAAKAMLDELGADYIMINGSMKGGIDTLRYDISNFASSMSITTSGRKYVIIDEGDYLTIQAQTAFRGLVEEFSANCGFIITCNFKNRIIEPIRESRFTTVEFSVPKDEKPKLEAQFYKRVTAILDEEAVEYSKEVVAKTIVSHFPDFRKTLNTFQTYAATGKIDAGILIDLKKDSMDELFKILKEKNFEAMRQWVTDNSDQDANIIFRNVYDMAPQKVEAKSLPGLIVTLGEYSYKHNFVSDPAINLAAFMTEIMYEATFK